MSSVTVRDFEASMCLVDNQHLNVSLSVILKLNIFEFED